MENLVYHARRMVNESNMADDAKMEVLDFLNLEDILALKEYRKLGTVKDLQDVFELCESLEKAVEAGNALVDELKKYQSIGTVEEFKALKEKNEPKKVVNYDKHYYKCPACGEDTGIDEDTLYIYGEEPPKFCSKCGKHFDWP